MSSVKVKRGDNVKVISGEDKGKTGKVLVASDGKVIVEGVNIVSRHTKPKSAQKTGGIVKSERPIQASKVMVVCPECNNETRVGFAIDAEGKKYRYCKNASCKANLDKTAVKETKKKDKKADKADKKEKPVKEEKSAKAKPNRKVSKTPETSPETAETQN